MNIIVLVCGVLSANTIRNFFAALAGRFLPDRWWAKPICFLAGAGFGLLYLYFAGYYIMDKDTNLLLAILVALIPLAASVVARIVRKESLIEN